MDTSDIEGGGRVPRQKVVVVISSDNGQAEDTVQKTCGEAKAKMVSHTITELKEEWV